MDNRMVFVLDNYDSFTYNLVQYLGELGAEITVRRNDQVSIAEIEAMNPARIVISPGPCTPRDAGISVELTLPYLSICAPPRKPKNSWNPGDVRPGEAFRHA